MANILLGVTGSVAAIHTPLLVSELHSAGHEVKVAATKAALYFFDRLQIATRESRLVIVDEDEWPGAGYNRGDPVLHIELRRWADLLLIAPLDANTLAKLAHGLCDNCLTCVWRAWDWSRPVVLAPAMNTLMWENPLTLMHFRLLAEAMELETPRLNLDETLDWLNKSGAKLRVVSPISKKLACDDVGIGALAERAEIVAAVGQLIAAPWL